MENTSGGGNAAAVPAEVDRWNWGAFLLSWIWGIGNNTFIAFLALVPIVGIVMPFVLGAKGSAWAWRKKRWESIELFRATQRQWARWGLATLVLFVILFIGLFVAIFASLKGADAYKLTVQALNSDRDAVQILGEPISTGIPMGSIRVVGPDGEASLSFSAEGPKPRGQTEKESCMSKRQSRSGNGRFMRQCSRTPRPASG